MNNDTLSQFSPTVESIHTAALQPDAWPQAMCQIAALQRAPRALLLTPELPASRWRTRCPMPSSPNGAAATWRTTCGLPRAAAWA